MLRERPGLLVSRDLKDLKDLPVKKATPATRDLLEPRDLKDRPDPRVIPVHQDLQVKPPVAEEEEEARAWSRAIRTGPIPTPFNLCSR